MSLDVSSVDRTHSLLFLAVAGFLRQFLAHLLKVNRQSAKIIGQFAIGQMGLVELFTKNSVDLSQAGRSKCEAVRSQCRANDCDSLLFLFVEHNRCDILIVTAAVHRITIRVEGQGCCFARARPSSEVLVPLLLLGQQLQFGATLLVLNHLNLEFVHELSLFPLSFLIGGQFALVVLMLVFEPASQFDVLLSEEPPFGLEWTQIGRAVDAVYAQRLLELDATVRETSDDRWRRYPIGQFVVANA